MECSLTLLASRVVTQFAVLATSLLAAQTVRDRGEAMWSRARAVSDIRHKDPAFQRKVEFPFIGAVLEPKKGTFTEWSVSGDQRRRQTESGGARQLEIESGPYKI